MQWEEQEGLGKENHIKQELDYKDKQYQEVWEIKIEQDQEKQKKLFGDNEEYTEK